MIDASRLLEEIRPAVAEVGRFQLSEWRKRPAGWAEEKAAKDLVTFVDRESEAMLSKALKAALPGSSFYGEEGEKSRGELTWVVDPVDGTTNYVCGLDWFCISVALYEDAARDPGGRPGAAGPGVRPKGVAGQGAGGVARPILGLVHRPAAGEWLWALRGGGAWEEGPGSEPRRLGAALETRLRNALVCTGTPYRSPDTAAAFYAAAAEVTASALDLRRLGSAALDLCMVAAGRLQAFWEVDLKAYDVGAALLLLEETGCPFSTFGGGRYDPFESGSLVAGSPGAVEELRAIVSRRYAGLRD
jgi:myo-inositol-1(or 4)-monophosphatase